MLSWKLECRSSVHIVWDSEYKIRTINLFFTVLLDMQALRCLSELISPAAAGASSVSYGTDDREPFLTVEPITSDTGGRTGGGQENTVPPQHVVIYPFPAHY